MVRGRSFLLKCRFLFSGAAVGVGEAVYKFRAFWTAPWLVTVSDFVETNCPADGQNVAGKKAYCVETLVKLESACTSKASVDYTIGLRNCAQSQDADEYAVAQSLLLGSGGRQL